MLKKHIFTMRYTLPQNTITKRIKKLFTDKIMGKYIIELNGETEIMLIDGAKSRNISPERFIEDIVNRYLPLSHIIDREKMAKGYIEMSEINLDLTK